MSRESPAIPIRVATFEVLAATCCETDDDLWSCQVKVRCKDGSQLVVEGQGELRERAVEGAISQFCVQPVQMTAVKMSEREPGHWQMVVALAERGAEAGRAGVGRYVSDQRETGLIVATLRAASHAGLLKAAYRANHQKIFRGWARELMRELGETLELDSLDDLKRLEAEGVVLEHTNRVASAAVVTAANYPKPDSILSLFDTSAWLFDGQGRRRDSYTNTELWLAWYPGIENQERTADEVIRSMPAAPATAIPWIVKLFENPESWIRFRGAVDLEDHDMLHVLLGRGLQDQDEAFVLGFAMGTAKRVRWYEYHIFRLVLSRLYPEPYRIPKFLLPAFDLGIRCGQETGAQDLYKLPLKGWRSLPLGDARQEAAIDMDIVRKYYELEQQQIPFTIASLRLP